MSALVYFFFFKQKTAYELRISDWSSDVCSSDLAAPEEPYTVAFGRARICAKGDDITIVGISNMAMECIRAQQLLAEVDISAEVIDPISLVPLDIEIGKASCRERVCQSV